MKPILVFFGIFSLALAGCGGAQNTADIAPVSNNTNTAGVAASFSEITDASLALAEGKRLLDENQTETAIAALRRSVEIDADQAEAHFYLGVAYALLDMQLQQSGQAVETVSNSNSKDKIPKTRSDLAYEEAVRAYKKWIDKNPKDDNAYYYLGRTYSKLTKDEEAEEAFQEAVDLKPEDTEYQTELGGILIKLAKYREAIKPLKKAIELDEANGRAIDLLEDAEAGRRRVDYVQANKNGNTIAGNKASNSDANVYSNTAVPSNSTSKTPVPSPKPKNTPPPKSDPKDARPRMVPRPN